MHNATFDHQKNHVLTPTFSKTPLKIPAKTAKPRVTPGPNFFCSFLQSQAFQSQISRRFSSYDAAPLRLSASLNRTIDSAGISISRFPVNPLSSVPPPPPTSPPTSNPNTARSHAANPASQDPRRRRSSQPNACPCPSSSASNQNVSSAYREPPSVMYVSRNSSIDEPLKCPPPM